ncbi:restriction endonuclease subunit S [Agrobacterium vitis]
MNDWTPARLGDLVEIKHGYAFKGEYFRDDPPGQILLTPGNFAIGGGFQFGKVKYYVGPQAPDYVLSAGDLLVTMTDLSKAGDTLGYPAIVPADDRVYLHNQRLGKVLLKSTDVEPGFIYWLLRTTEYRAEVLASCTGSTVKHTSPGRIQAFRFLLPPREHRERICETLNSLDDKIDVNQRINETLEAMAQAIFRDWFVDFGPSRRKLNGATDPITVMGGLVQDGEQAQILSDLFSAKLGGNGLPEGWVEKPFSTLVDIIGGGTPKTSIERYWSGPLPWFSVTDTPSKGSVFVDFTEKTISMEGLENSAARLVRAGTTIISARGTVGNLAIAAREMTFNQSCYGLQGKGAVGDCFVFLSAQNIVQRLKGMAHGSVFSTITRATFDGVDIVCSDNAIFEAFEQIVGLMFEKISSNVEENRSLAETRDLLLPKLMSGELRMGPSKRAD